jgi:hypothetical protein
VGGIWYFSSLKKQDIPPAPQTPVVQIKLPLVDQIGKHIILPSGEEPTIATVVDVRKLLQQSFFLHAKNGDKVLLYPKAQIAYLYRPSIDKIITVSPLTIQKQVTTTKPGSIPKIPGPLEVLGAATSSAGVKIENK